MNFTDLKIWQESHNLSLKVYKETQKFPKSEIFGIISQIQRCSSSVPANIAEGFGRKTKNEFIQFLTQARGSLYESQNFIYLSRDLGYISKENSEILINEYESLAKMLNSFISKVKYNND